MAPEAFKRSSKRSGSPAEKKATETHQASCLVGRIVEKGFVDNAAATTFSLPRPAVLPFPVARHRSHGPHWTPVSSFTDVEGKEEEEEESYKDEDYYGLFSAFANAVERKEKKGMNFSRWREFVSNESPAKPGIKAKESDPLKMERKKKSYPSAVTSMEIDAANSEDSVLEGCDMEVESSVQKMSIPRVKPVQPEVSPIGAPSGSLMDDISAENLARLEKMTPEEIAEARMEILEKMDPALVDLLRKRGRDKLGNKSGGKLDKERVVTKDDISKLCADSDGLATKAEEVRFRDCLLSSGVPGGSIWKEWSERVEKVRGFRFSLEGDAFDLDSTELQFNGKGPDKSQYNVENVAERDFLRTEGDPAAMGYTIEEAVALLRSMVPAQRAFALHLLASVLNKASHGLQKDVVHYGLRNSKSVDTFVDWQAVWAFALGPEPKLALSLRILLEDNHESVVLACIRVIQCILCCDINERFFTTRESLTAFKKGLCTAPIFRSKPEIKGSFLKGGFWKYNTKPSNILPFENDHEDEENEEKHTIQDDVVVAEQDFAAGLVRMGILPRICYLLEMDPSPNFVEGLLSILVALARHSPSLALAVARCPRLVEAIVKLCTMQGIVGILPYQIKATVFLKVLSQSSKQICVDLIRRGAFQGAMWQWYRNPGTLEDWLNSGLEQCRLASALMVEQLCLWKVCIEYGNCIPYFADFFAYMLLWLNAPNFDKLVEQDMIVEFASVSKEAYFVLEALARKLPVLHSAEASDMEASIIPDDNLETWSWSHTVPIVDIALTWLSLRNIPYLSMFMASFKNSSSFVKNSRLLSLLGVVSAVLSMLCSVLERIAPEKVDGNLPWLPQFVPKVGLEMISNRFLNFTFSDAAFEDFGTDGGSLAEFLIYLRCQNDPDASLASATCFSSLVRLALSIDRCIQRARNTGYTDIPKEYESGVAGRILEKGMAKHANFDWVKALDSFTTFFSEELFVTQSIELFGRGGPAPGVGFGWGCSGGGFWSPTVLLAQVDAHVILDLLEVLPLLDKDGHSCIESELEIMSQSLNKNRAALKILLVFGVFLVAGPGDQSMCDQALDLFLQVPVLKFLSFCVQQLSIGRGCKSALRENKEEDYLFVSRTLKAHFRNIWLDCKKKSPVATENGIYGKAGPLETIHEGMETSDAVQHSECRSFLAEWAFQRLPLPTHWFLSAISSINECKTNRPPVSSAGLLDVVKSGVWLLLGLEAMQIVHFNSRFTPISGIPLVWKLHALSMALLICMDVLEDEGSRNAFETLQEIYGLELDQMRHTHVQGIFMSKKATLAPVDLENEEDRNRQLLNFQPQVHESYTTFIEGLIEQFGAISYGDSIYGRQVSLYLHRRVEDTVRLAAWNSMSAACVLELLPPLDKCISDPEGYLNPIEDNEKILEAYAKCWSSGHLDRAASRDSVGFTLALHHLSSFIFSHSSSDRLPLRNRLAKYLLRGYSHRQHQEGMLLRAVRYGLTVSQDPHEVVELERRFAVLVECCEENSSLLRLVDVLKKL